MGNSYRLFSQNKCGTPKCFMEEVIDICKLRDIDISIHSQNNSIDIKEIMTFYFRDNKRSIKWRSEDYNMTFKYEIDIDTFGVDYFSDLIDIINHFLKRSEGDFVIESNYDTPVIIRKGNVISVNQKFIDNGADFKNLDFDYKREALKVV